MTCMHVQNHTLLITSIMHLVMLHLCCVARLGLPQSLQATRQHHVKSSSAVGVDMLTLLSVSQLLYCYQKE